MSLLRTISTRRLVALLIAVVAVVAGRRPRSRSPRAGRADAAAQAARRAVHDALTRPAVEGITARITFTNHLIDAVEPPGRRPAAHAAPSGRLWARRQAAPELRLELQSDDGDAQIVSRRQTAVGLSTPARNTVYRGTLPAARPRQGTAPTEPVAVGRPDPGSADRLHAAARLSGAQPSNVAGPARLHVRVAPRTTAACSAPPSSRGTPRTACRCARRSTPAATATPVLELKADRHLATARSPPSTFAVARPRGAQVVDLARRAGGADTARRARRAPVTGVGAVAGRVPFTLVAPDDARRPAAPRGPPRRLRRAAGALVTYGQGLGGIAVIEQPAEARHRRPRHGGATPAAA